ncbi:e6d4bc74-1738-4e07-8d7b-37abf2551938-CDS [Sclerotinia trifoliorum]|uniref:E6d4bc74-1738-4e07-8d7b-37abf2551938-CDS n=1 Tax=Sclerotinia trifoliorum TaxID=28548 RepID=A0A8H2VYD3_9HELO|nr:e6d4bc74-1738-4e07-8d7b-37abf2551938-CDS [Sclerotinia trifoliorum]
MNFACWTCDETFTSKREMIWHCQQYGHTRAWVCEHCDKPFGSGRSREQHIEDKHEFWCFSCQEVFSTEDDLDLHNITQHYFPCGFGCDRSFNSTQARDQHINDVHNYRCYDCDQKFMSKQAVEQHEAAYHDFQCKPCDREFRSQSALEQHVNSSAHPYRCSKCNKSFPFSNDLQQHIAANHTWKCDQCYLTFDGPNHLNLHKKSEHQVIKCLNCPAKFDQSAELQSHKAQQHSLQCRYCTALPFETFSLLEQHTESSHSLKCTACPKRFAYEAVRNKHFEEAHIHICKLCGSKFNSLAHLNHHCLSHHVACSSCKEIFENIAACELHYTKAHRLCCPKCPKTFNNVDEVLQHAPEHMKPVVPADAESLIQADFEKTALNRHNLKYGQNTCNRCGAMFFKRLDLQNHLANDHGLQLKCLRPDCDHISTTSNACTRHFLSCNMVKCENCEGYFDKDKDPELKAHIAKIHTPNPIFGCVQCTRTFESSDAVAQHYSAEHAFICEACPGTFFINSATRERHFATCGNLSETSDSGESFQTSRTEFSPFMKGSVVPPKSTKISSPPNQPLVRIHEEFNISKMNAIENLAQKILDEANAQQKPTYQCPKCDIPLLEFEDDEYEL